jgi:hypothetical protein
MSSQAAVDNKVPVSRVDHVDDIDVDPKEERALVCASFFDSLIFSDSYIVSRFGVWIYSS